MIRQVVCNNQQPVTATDQAGVSTSIPIRDVDGNMNEQELLTSQLLFSNGGFGVGMVAITATGTVSATVAGERLNAASGAITRTLPVSITVLGQIFIFKKIDSSGNLPTIAANGSDTNGIDGASTYTGLSAQYKTVALQANGLGYDILWTH